MSKQKLFVALNNKHANKYQNCILYMKIKHLYYIKYERIHIQILMNEWNEGKLDTIFQTFGRMPNELALRPIIKTAGKVVPLINGFIY